MDDKIGDTYPHLMEHTPRTLAHLVELVNAAHSVVGQHEGSGLQDELSARWE